MTRMNNDTFRTCATSARSSAASPRCKTSTWTSQGRVRLFPRPFGLRQDDAAAHHRGAGGADFRRGAWQNGRDISRLPPALRDYGIVFQSYALFPNLSAWPTTWPMGW
jgi:hypothetical protein